MAIAKHLMKRILMMLAGYLVSVFVGLIAIVALYVALSSLPNAPEYFGLMSMTPVAILVVPPLGMFVFFLAIVVTGLQSLIFALIAEFFSLRNFALHMFFGAAAAAGGFAMIGQTSLEDVDPERWADIAIIAAAGLFAGLVYWLIAGRDAGFRRPISQL